MKKGFTMLDVLIAIVILGILALVAVPRYLKNQENVNYNFPGFAEAKDVETVSKAIEKSITRWDNANQGVAKQAVVIWVWVTSENDQQSAFAFKMKPEEDYLANLKLEVERCEDGFKTKVAWIKIQLRILYKPPEVAQGRDKDEYGGAD